MKKHPSRFPEDGGRKPGRRIRASKASGAARGARPKAKAGKSAGSGSGEAAWLPPGMLRLKNGRIVREGEVVVFVRLRSGGDGVYILSEDLIHLPADLLIGEIEIDRGISLDSPLILHPESED